MPALRVQRRDSSVEVLMAYCPTFNPALCAADLAAWGAEQRPSDPVVGRWFKLETGHTFKVVGRRGAALDVLDGRTIRAMPTDQFEAALAAGILNEVNGG